MTFQLLSCLVIVSVLQFHTQPCQGNPVEDDAATGSDNQTLINEYPKANESVTAIVNPVEDDAASDFDNQTSKDYESVTAIMDDCISKLKEINLEGIEGITKKEKILYKDSLRQLINAKKELQYNHIDLETYAESTIDEVDELSRLINEIDSNLSLKQIKEKLEYNAKKIVSLIDKSKKLLKTVRSTFTDIDNNLTNTTSDMKDLQRRVESLKEKTEEEKDEFERKLNSTCTWWNKLWCSNDPIMIEKVDSLTWQMERITIVLEGFSIIPKIKETNDDVSKQLTSVVEWWVQTREMSSKDFADEDSIYAGIQGNKQDILSQLAILKQACQNYISHGMQNKNKGQEVDNAMVSSTDMKNISASQ